MNRFLDTLQGIGACHNALEWVGEQGNAALVHYWAACPNGEWFLWLFSRLVEERVVDKSVVLKALVACAHLRVPLIGDQQLRDMTRSVLNGVTGAFDARVNHLELRDRVFHLTEDARRGTDPGDRNHYWVNAICDIGRRTYTQTLSGFHNDVNRIYVDLLFTGLGASKAEQAQFLEELRKAIPWDTAKAAWQEYAMRVERGAP